MRADERLIRKKIARLQEAIGNLEFGPTSISGDVGDPWADGADMLWIGMAYGAASTADTLDP
jgi:hypothetical protein